MTLAVFLVATITLMLVGVPVVFAFTLGGLLFASMVGVELSTLMPAAVRSIDSFTLLALPMFILLGALMRDSDLSSRMITLSKALVGRFTGGLGAVTILSCAVFGAISGSASAAITSIGAMMIPELERDGYSKGYATGLVAASSLLSLMIPPSIPMIIFAMAARISIKDAFLSTMVPAFLVVILYGVINYVWMRRHPPVHRTPDGHDEPDASGPPATARVQPVRIWPAFRKSSLALLLPVVVLGGIYGGIFTATEAAAIGCLAAIVIGMLIYRTLSPHGLYKGLWESMLMAGAIVLLLFVVTIIGRVMVLDGVPEQLAALITGVTDSKWKALLMINIILLIMGMLVDDVSGNILSASLLLPAAVSLGVDPVHFAAISVINLSLGNLTPPVAPMLYLAGMVHGKTPVSQYIKPTMIFLLFGALPVVLAVTFIPVLSMGLVELFR